MFSIPTDEPRMLAYRAPSLFQPHRARQALRDAHEGRIPPLVGLYLGLSTVPGARWMAPMGWDAVWIDWEHSSCNVETMTTMVHEIMFMSEGRSIPFVRVPGTDHAAIGYALDAGASLVIPQVDTVEQCQHACSAAKFGSKNRGTRSAPPFRFSPGLTDVVADEKVGDIYENLNAQAAIIIQIESLEGINNLDAILEACPDVDAVWLGTLDARVSMSLPANFGMGGDEKEWQDAVVRYTAACKKHDKPMSGFCLPPMPGWEEKGKGLAFMVTAADVFAMMMTREALLAARGQFPATPKKAEIEEIYEQAQAKAGGVGKANGTSHA